MSTITFLFSPRIERKIATISLESKSPQKTVENGRCEAC